jgi:hypothetical protein
LTVAVDASDEPGSATTVQAQLGRPQGRQEGRQQWKVLASQQVQQLQAKVFEGCLLCAAVVYLLWCGEILLRSFLAAALVL